MGRITIFTGRGCRDTPRIITLLASKNIPYSVIDLTNDPDRHNDLLSLCGCINVPQVFLNDVHVGDFTTSVAFLDTWTLERYQQHVARCADPTDKRLRLAGKQESAPASYGAPHHSSSISGKSKAAWNFLVMFPDGTDLRAGDLMRKLQTTLRLRKRRYKLTEYHNCCLGNEVLASIQLTIPGCAAEADAIIFVQQLQELGIIRHVCDDHHPIDDRDNRFFYRLQCHHTPAVLNSLFVVPDRYILNNQKRTHKTRSVRQVLAELESKLNAILEDVTVMDGIGCAMVNYKAAKDHPAFGKLEEALCELHIIDFANLEGNHRLAFAINLYNLMIRFAYVRHGYPETPEGRRVFLATLRVRVGSEVLSFQTLQQTIISGYVAKLSSSGMLPSPYDSARVQLTLRSAVTLVSNGHTLDHDTSYGQSMPVRLFTAANLDYELRLTAAAFCERDCNVYLDPIHNRIVLVESVEHLGKDLKLDHQELLRLLVEMMKVTKGLKSAKRQSLEAMLSKSKNILVDFLPFACNPVDGESFERFDPNLRLEANQKILRWRHRRQRNSMKHGTTDSGSDDGSVSIPSSGTVSSDGNVSHSSGRGIPRRNRLSIGFGRP